MIGANDQQPIYQRVSNREARQGASRHPDYYNESRLEPKSGHRGPYWRQRVARLTWRLTISLALIGPVGVHAATPSAVVAAAVANPARPTVDVQRDADRKPAATLAFAGIEPGQKVADYIANSGYFTRLFADVVGPKGHVYAVELNEIVGSAGVAKGYADLKDWAQGRANVTIQTGPSTSSPGFPEKLDAFWISQNYHDLHDKFLGPVDIAAFNRAVFAALKRGGVYIVLDHVAAAGAPADVTETLHRIDPAVVRREIEAAGFRFDGESQILANPADPHTVGMWDKSVKGRTDQFLYRFRKP